MTDLQDRRSNEALFYLLSHLFIIYREKMDKISNLNPFKKKLTPKELAQAAKRETTKEVRSGQREMEREIRSLEREEKKLLLEIKQRAKQPGVKGMDDPALKSMAKNLVQIRSQRNKMIAQKTHLSSVAMTATSMATQVTATAAIGSVSTAMSKANKAIDAKEMSKIMVDFTRQNEVMEVRQEMMDDLLTDVFDSEGVEEEADEVTGQVLAELGIELDSQMVGLTAPSSKVSTGETVQEEEEDFVDLRARLDAL